MQRRMKTSVSLATLKKGASRRLAAKYGRNWARVPHVTSVFNLRQSHAVSSSVIQANEVRSNNNNEEIHFISFYVKILVRNRN